MQFSSQQQSWRRENSMRSEAHPALRRSAPFRTPSRSSAKLILKRIDAGPLPDAAAQIAFLDWTKSDRLRRSNLLGAGSRERSSVDALRTAYCQPCIDLGLINVGL
jgi:hypothetical protein